MWIAIALLFQNAILTQHALAMATGIEVCSVAGPTRVDADGHPLKGGDLKHHDCCCATPLAAPPVARTLPPMPSAGRVAAAPVTAARLAADWLAPLSRGPPARG